MLLNDRLLGVCVVQTWRNLFENDTRKHLDKLGIGSGIGEKCVMVGESTFKFYDQIFLSPFVSR